MTLIFWQIILGKNRRRRTLRNTQSAVNAFLWINHQKIGTDVKTIDRTDFNTIGVFAFNAIFGHYKCHDIVP
jgi:hypothetical protein